MPLAARYKRFVLALAALCCVQPGATIAQEPEEETPEPRRSGLIPIPIFYYTPETSFAFGAAVQYYFRPAEADVTSRPSTLVPVFVYTTRNQVTAEFNSELWWDQEANHFFGFAVYSRFPDKFYGIGNDTSQDDE